ncbi:MAG TPA: APC family permease [Terriglobales bacterium]|nr:APC family permease [Terriglobales bacterium]
MSIVDTLFGRPLATEEEKAERIGPIKGIPIFGLDALSSAAYGPEAALTLLIPLGMAGAAYVWPITIGIVVLLGIVYFSYRQTIAAYPQGGGSYTVATENLGEGAGLLAAAALMIDYVLTAAVGISAGVGALVSAVPSLQSKTLWLCLGILLVITIVNLRGMRESGGVFLLPTYVFIACLLGLIAVGIFKTLMAGGHPIPVVAPPKLTAVTATVSAWLLLRTFSSGCTAMTGVEAVSNGVMAFRDPTDKYAKLTLTIIIGILMMMLVGIAFLVPAYGLAATDPGATGYESVLSQLLGAVTGKGAFYWVSIGSILVVLSLSANTAFADFPRLARAIAQNGYLPHAFVLRGRRLVFAQGVYALALLTGVLLIIFGGVTDRLIPLYAVGAFLAFTLSQAGMVVHWRRHAGPGATRNMLVNGLGALATGITTAVVLVAKFVDGAWITVLLIPALMLMMRSVKRHYKVVGLEINTTEPVETTDLREPIVLLPLDRWSLVADKALRYAWTLSKEIHVLHVHCGEETHSLCRIWGEMVEKPARAAGLPLPKLVVLDSPYRFIVKPIVEYAIQQQTAQPDRNITMLIPELVESHWYHYFLHNNRPEAIRALLLFNGNQRITVASLPYHLRA